jgi:cullin 3
VQDAIDRFSTFYLEKHTGRKLSWQTSAGAAELKATFGSGPDKYRRHELLVSTYQMCILMLFNNTDFLTLRQIRTQTQIPDSELRRHLISLCTPKHRILRKGNKGKGITSDEDVFSFNFDYTSKLKRVRIPLVKEASVTARGSGDGDGGGTSAAGGGSTDMNGGMASLSAEASAIDGSVPAPVEEDRRHLVEAAIVRIMKARKALHHNDLIAEVSRQLSVRFSPAPQFIKKRVESLIEREYLERAEDDRRVYTYVA